MSKVLLKRNTSDTSENVWYCCSGTFLFSLIMMNFCFALRFSEQIVLMWYFHKSQDSKKIARTNRLKWKKYEKPSSIKKSSYDSYKSSCDIEQTWNQFLLLSLVVCREDFKANTWRLNCRLTPWFQGNTSALYPPSYATTVCQLFRAKKLNLCLA